MAQADQWPYCSPDGRRSAALRCHEPRQHRSSSPSSEYGFLEVHELQTIQLTSLPDGLVNSAMPTILVSCKCDNPENTRQIDVESMEAACLSCVEALKCAGNVPESARLCLASMLRAIMAKRNGQFSWLVPRHEFSSLGSFFVEPGSSFPTPAVCRVSTPLLFISCFRFVSQLSSCSREKSKIPHMRLVLTQRQMFPGPEQEREPALRVLHHIPSILKHP